MNFSFENKVALVTGVGSGMGLAAAQAFAAERAAVALVDINESAVRTAAERLVAGGHKAMAIRCDVTDEAQVKAMVEQIVSKFGRLDAAFNNAGVQSLAVETADATSEEHLLGWMVSALRSREDLVLENLALRQQLLALHAKTTSASIDYPAQVVLGRVENVLVRVDRASRLGHS
jgi:NAD(P)-dependent dehydrogenase (short-subunit alcohol dehydrogenase family)